MAELWKNIPGFEDCYQVSSSGRVRSLERQVKNSTHNLMRPIQEMIMNPWDNGNGYLVVSLSKNGMRKNHYVHRLVAAAFIDNPDNKLYVNHIDYNKKNNAASNLEWCTQLENVRYSAEHMKGERNKYRISSTGEKYITIRRAKREKIKYRVNISRLGVDRSFDSFEDAVCYRNEVMQTWQNQ